MVYTKVFQRFKGWFLTCIYVGSVPGGHDKAARYLQAPLL